MTQKNIIYIFLSCSFIISNNNILYVNINIDNNNKIEVLDENPADISQNNIISAHLNITERKYFNIGKDLVKNILEKGKYLIEQELEGNSNNNISQEKKENAINIVLNTNEQYYNRYGLYYLVETQILGKANILKDIKLSNEDLMIQHEKKIKIGVLNDIYNNSTNFPNISKKKSYNIITRFFFYITFFVYKYFSKIFVITNWINEKVTRSFLRKYLSRKNTLSLISRFCTCMIIIYIFILSILLVVNIILSLVNLRKFPLNKEHYDFFEKKDLESEENNAVVNDENNAVVNDENNSQDGSVYYDVRNSEDLNEDDEENNHRRNLFINEFPGSDASIGDKLEEERSILAHTSPSRVKTTVQEKIITDLLQKYSEYNILHKYHNIEEMIKNAIKEKLEKNYAVIEIPYRKGKYILNIKQKDIECYEQDIKEIASKISGENNYNSYKSINIKKILDECFIFYHVKKINDIIQKLSDIINNVDGFYFNDIKDNEIKPLKTKKNDLDALIKEVILLLKNPRENIKELLNKKSINSYLLFIKNLKHINNFIEYYEKNISSTILENLARNNKKAKFSAYNKEEYIKTLNEIKREFHNNYKNYYDDNANESEEYNINIIKFFKNIIEIVEYECILMGAFEEYNLIQILKNDINNFMENEENSLAQIFVNNNNNELIEFNKINILKQKNKEEINNIYEKILSSDDYKDLQRKKEIIVRSFKFKIRYYWMLWKHNCKNNITSNIIRFIVIKAWPALGLFIIIPPILYILASFFCYKNLQTEENTHSLKKILLSYANEKRGILLEKINNAIKNNIPAEEIHDIIKNFLQHSVKDIIKNYKTQIVIEGKNFALQNNENIMFLIFSRLLNQQKNKIDNIIFKTYHTFIKMHLSIIYNISESEIKRTLMNKFINDHFLSDKIIEAFLDTGIIPLKDNETEDFLSYKINKII